MIFPIAGNNWKKIIIMKNEKTKFSAENLEFGATAQLYCKTLIVLQPGGALVPCVLQ